MRVRHNGRYPWQAEFHLLHCLHRWNGGAAGLEATLVKQTGDAAGAKRWARRFRLIWAQWGIW